MKPKKTQNYTREEISELARELRQLRQSSKNPKTKNIEISTKQNEDSKVMESNLSGSQQYDNSFSRKNPSINNTNLNNRNNKKWIQQKLDSNINNSTYENVTKTSNKKENNSSIIKNRKTDDEELNNLEDEYIQPHNVSTHLNIFRPTRIKKDSNLYHIYTTYKNKINDYLKNNKDNIKLYGNYKYTNKTPDYYFKAKQNEEEEEKLEKEKEEEDKGKVYDLTPLPAKSRKKMKSNYEKNQFYEGERAAVAMRRLEYNKQFDLRMQKQQESKLKKYITKIVFIQRWWRNILAKLYLNHYAILIQKFWRGYLIRNKLNDMLKIRMIENGLLITENVYNLHLLKDAFDKIKNFKREGIKINKGKNSGFNNGYYISKDYISNDVVEIMVIIQSFVRMYLTKKKIKKLIQKDKEPESIKIPKIEYEQSFITKIIKSPKDELEQVMLIQKKVKEIIERRKKKISEKVFKKPKSSDYNLNYIEKERIGRNIKRKVIKPLMMTKTIKYINKDDEDKLKSKTKSLIEDNPELLLNKKQYPQDKYLSNIKMIQSNWREYNKSKQKPEKINKSAKDSLISKEYVKKMPTLILPKRDNPAIYKITRIRDKDYDINNIIFIQDEWKKKLQKKLNNDKTNLKVIKLNKDLLNNGNYISKDIIQNVEDDVELIQTKWKNKRNNLKENEIEPIRKNKLDNLNGSYISKTRNSNDKNQEEEILKIPNDSNNYDNSYISKEYKNKEDEIQFIQNVIEIQETYKKYRNKKVNKSFPNENEILSKPLISTNCYVNKSRNNYIDYNNLFNNIDQDNNFITKAIYKNRKNDLDKIKLIQKEFREFENSKKYKPNNEHLETEYNEEIEIIGETKDQFYDMEYNTDVEIL